MVRHYRAAALYRLALVGFTALGMWLAATDFASAQLRTGSGNRSLYQRTAARSQQSELKSSNQSGVKESLDVLDKDEEPSAPVVSASHEVLAQKVVKSGAVRTAGSAIRSSEVRPAGCTSCGSGAITSGSVLEAESPMIEQAIGCSSCGCSACDGGFAEFDGCCDNGCGNMCGSNYGGYIGPLHALLSRMSFRIEAPMFWRHGQSTPALVTTDINGTNANSVLRSGVYDDEVHAGFRINMFQWLDNCQQRALMFRYWNAGTFSDNSVFSSNQFPTLARPFSNTTSGTATADTQVIASPGDSVGSITINTRSAVYGLDLMVRRMAYGDRFTRIDWLYGYNHVSIAERLGIASQTTVTGNVPPLQGSSISVSDNFATSNSLNGFALGAMSTRTVGCFQLESMFRMTLGNLERKIAINGQTTTVSSDTTTTPEGLLARSTNIRSIASNTFVLAPEVGLNLAYAIGPNIDFSIGYNYLMVPKVAQASRQLDPNMDANLSSPLSGSADPAFPFQTSRYWVRSLGLGAQIRY